MQTQQGCADPESPIAVSFCISTSATSASAFLIILQQIYGAAPRENLHMLCAG